MPRVSRRGLLLGGAFGVGTAAAASAATALSLVDPRVPADPPDAPAAVAAEPFHGPHQAGVATAPQTHAAFLALDLGPAPIAPPSPG